MKEKRIIDYLKFLTGTDFEVEFIDDTVVIIKEDQYRIYFSEGVETMFIGTYSESEHLTLSIVYSCKNKILDIYNNVE